MKSEFTTVTDKDGAKLDLGTVVQVVERNHQNEGMVGEIKVIDPAGRLKLESRHGTPFNSAPEDVRKVEQHFCMAQR